MKTSRQVGSLPSRVTLMSLTKTEREEIAEERSQQGKILEEDQEKAKDIRLEAMEKLSQTKKPKENCNDPPKTSQRTSSKAISFLSEKKKKTWIPNELKLRSKKYERGRKRCDEAEKRHDSMMQMFVYQNQLMLSIISKLADKQCFLVLTCFHHRHFVCVKVFVI